MASIHQKKPNPENMENVFRAEKLISLLHADLFVSFNIFWRWKIRKKVRQEERKLFNFPFKVESFNMGVNSIN